MSIKNLIARGIGFTPGSISYIPTLGFSIGAGGGGGNSKKISVPHNVTALTIYAIIRREIDSYLLNNADGVFGVSPANPYLALAEDSIIKSLYEVIENRTAWNDGRYYIVAYKQIGGSPAPVSDTMIAAGHYAIKDDTEVYQDVLLSTRLATASYTAPDNAGIAALPLLTEIEASTVLAKQAKLDFVEKWVLNKLVESTDGMSVTLYDDDNTTPLKTWAYSPSTKTRSKAT